MADISNLADKPLKTIMNPLLMLPVGDNPPEEVNMLVENPMGSHNKYEYHTNTGLMKLDRVLYARTPFPLEYGCIPQTWDEDQDLLDVICLVTYPTFPGCLISVRVIGVVKFNDSGEVDDKIIGVPVDDNRYKNIKSLDDISDHQKEEITFFFEHYKDVQFKLKGETEKTTVVESWLGVEEAAKTIEACHQRFLEKFGDIAAQQ